MNPPLLILLESTKNILRFYPISRRWIANPNNFVAFKVQEARAKTSPSLYTVDPTIF
jgi:hypothetical protein